jgi:thioredoxin 1
MGEMITKVCKVNADEEPGLAQAFGVVSIPTLAVMKHGKVAARAVGLRPKEALLAMIA